MPESRQREPAHRGVLAEDLAAGADGGHRAAQLVAAELAERVLVVGVEVRQLGRDDLALLAEGAGEHVDLVTGGDVVGDGDAGRERLVVGVGVDEEQPRGPPADQDRLGAGHRDTPTTPSSGTPP